MCGRRDWERCARVEEEEEEEEEGEQDGMKKEVRRG